MPLDLDEAAAMLGVAPDTVRRWARQGRLGVRRPSGGFRFEVDELQRWARNQGLRLHQAAGPASVAGLDPQHHPLAAALARGAVLHDVLGEGPESVLRDLVERAPLAEDVDRDALLTQLLEREAMATTALGAGVALPHPRTPSAAFVTQPTVVVGMLAGEVGWHAFDGEPVHSAILLLSPTPREHLQVLSRLAFLLRDGRFGALLRGRAEAEEVVAAVVAMEPEAG